MVVCGGALCAFYCWYNVCVRTTFRVVTAFCQLPNKRICYVMLWCVAGDGGGYLSSYRRVLGGGVDRGQGVHGPRVRRPHHRRPGQGCAQLAPVRPRRAGAQEQDRRVPAGRRRDLSHGQCSAMMNHDTIRCRLHREAEKGEPVFFCVHLFNAWQKLANFFSDTLRKV